jgi:hypothetical protein
VSDEASDECRALVLAARRWMATTESLLERALGERVLERLM